MVQEDGQASEAVPSLDGVFLHCMSLHKGRSMLARAVRLLHAPLATPEGLPGESPQTEPKPVLLDVCQLLEPLCAR